MDNGVNDCCYKCPDGILQYWRGVMNERGQQKGCQDVQCADETKEAHGDVQIGGQQVTDFEDSMKDFVVRRVCLPCLPSGLS